MNENQSSKQPGQEFQKKLEWSKRKETLETTIAICKIPENMHMLSRKEDLGIESMKDIL